MKASVWIFMVLNEEKITLRQEMRQRRSSISSIDRKLYEDDIAERLYRLPAIKNAKCIGVYHGVNSEASIDDFTKALWLLDPTPTIASPVIHENGLMSFYSIHKGERIGFAENPFQITPITDIPADRYVDACDIDILLVPGIAFDEECRRLGQGGGYYDRYLPHLRPDCISVGIAFDEQILAQVPTGVHDRRVDYVLTPTRIIQR